MTTSRFSFGTRYFGSKLLSVSTLSLDLSRSRTCPTEALTLYPLPKNLPTVRAFAGDSTMTNLVVFLRFPRRFCFFLRGAAVTSGRGKPSCAGVSPMRNIVVPHSGHIPRVAARPVFVKTAFGSCTSRFSLHFMQYAVIFSSAITSPLDQRFSYQLSAT